MTHFPNRREAGRRLAKQASPEIVDSDHAFALALSVPAVPVAVGLAEVWDCPADLYLTNTVGVPGHEELTMGVLDNEGVSLLDRDAIQRLQLPRQTVEESVDAKREELTRTDEAVRLQRPQLGLRGRHVVAVDDGQLDAEALTAALMALRQHEPQTLVLALPLVSFEMIETFRNHVDHILTVEVAERFLSPAELYEEFPEVSAETARELLAGVQ